MRVLVLSQYYDPDPISKPSDVAEYLVSRGHNVTVLCGLPNYPTGRLAPGYRLRPLLRERRAQVDVFRVAELPYHGKSVVRRIANYGSFLVSAAIFGLFVPRPDVIYVWHPPLTNGVAAWWLGFVHRAAFVLDVQDIWPDEGVTAGVIREGRLVGFFRRIERFVYRKAGRIVVVTEGVRRNLISKGVPPGKIEVLPNWVDPSWFSTPEAGTLAEARREIRGSCRFVCTFAGNVGYMQGLETVIRAAHLLREQKDIGFRIIGTGPAEAQLRALATELRLANVEFMGQRPRSETAALLHASDALVVHLRAGPTADLVVPTKTLAYLAVGRPIVMAVEGEAAALVRASGSGITVPPDDPAALAEALVQLASKSAEELADMAQRGKAYARDHYSREDLTQKLELTLEQTTYQADVGSAKARAASQASRNPTRRKGRRGHARELGE